MTRSQNRMIADLHRKHSVDVKHFGCRINTTDMGHAIVLSVLEGQGADLKLRYSYVIGKRGGVT